MSPLKSHQPSSPLVGLGHFPGSSVKISKIVIKKLGFNFVKTKGRALKIPEMIQQALQFVNDEIKSLWKYLLNLNT